jgi:hypothetical protein
LRETIGKKIVKALKKEEDGVTYAAIEFLNALMQVKLSKFQNKLKKIRTLLCSNV